MSDKIVKYNKSKAKGNKFERDVARELSTWFFNDSSILYRDASSGGRPTGFKGDIIVYDAAKFQNYWSSFVLLLELKCGYKQHLPTFINFTKTSEWIVKAISQLNHVQTIPILILQFTNYSPLLLSQIQFCVWTDMMIAIRDNGNIHQFYVYKYYDLLKEDFYQITPIEILNQFVKPAYLGQRIGAFDYES